MPTAESWPTEDAATGAVDAAARDAWTRFAATKSWDGNPPGFDDLDATVQLQFREVVLPAVWAALTALPDPRYAAWEQGRTAGEIFQGIAENPYPAPSVPDTL
jgi:hypothetical protein